MREGLRQLAEGGNSLPKSATKASMEEYTM